MRSVILAGLMAASAYAAPKDKRAYVTDLEIVTVTKTVTAGDQVETILSISSAAPVLEQAVEPEQTSAQTSIVVFTPSPSSTSTPTPTPTSFSTEVASAAAVSSTLAISTIELSSTQAAYSTQATSSAVVAVSSSAATSFAVSSSAASSSADSAATGSCVRTGDAAIPTGFSGSDTATTDAQTISLKVTNYHRANHTDTCSLLWDSSLEASATTIANTCTYKHQLDVNGGGYGQNIAVGISTDEQYKAINMFYDEESTFASIGGYGSSLAGISDSTFEEIGHFTQLVWKDTYAMACVTVDCTDVDNDEYPLGSERNPNGIVNVADSFDADSWKEVSPYFTVCNYKTPGNYAGEYNVNIGSLIADPLEPICESDDQTGCVDPTSL